MSRRRQPGSPRRRPASSVREPRRGAIDGTPGSLYRTLLSDPDAAGLVVSVALDPDDVQETHAVVRFRGHRLDIGAHPTARDAFVKDEPVGPIIPGSGPISITTRVYGIPSGRWTVTAELVRHAPQRRRSARPSPRSRALRPAVWSWRRWRLEPTASDPIRTRGILRTFWGAQPAAINGSWPVLVLIGTAVALILTATLLDRRDLAGGWLIVPAFAAILFGVVGAKVWYVLLDVRRWRARLGIGWCIQGAIAGAGTALTAILLLLDRPVGVVLGATTPGLLLAMAIGRVGCFLTGCCCGRMTSSRWGIWSTDRRIGARRIPTQLMEALLAGSFGTVLLWAALTERAPLSLAYLLFGVAGYTAFRQVVLRRRAQTFPPARMIPVFAVSVGVVTVVLACWLVGPATATSFCHRLTGANV